MTTLTEFIKTKDSDKFTFELACLDLKHEVVKNSMSESHTFIIEVDSLEDCDKVHLLKRKLEL
jgi:hypothetical protein